MAGASSWTARKFTVWAFAIIVWFTDFAVAADTTSPPVSRLLHSNKWESPSLSVRRLFQKITPFQWTIDHNNSRGSTFWKGAPLLVFSALSVTFAIALWWKETAGSKRERNGLKTKSPGNSPKKGAKPRNDATDTDPGLLKRHSTFESYTAAQFSYPSIRTFYHPHPQVDKLPSTPTPLPLLVFVHGLGGSLAQFHLLLSSFVNVGPCLGIDLPGCGRSSFEPTDWKAYSLEALTSLLETAISKYLNKHEGQGFILIAHSMGCSISALLASEASPISSSIRRHAVGLISICPRADPPSQKEVGNYHLLLNLPNPIFNLFRMWDRRGGIDSASVSRFVGKDGDRDTKRLQELYNEQSKTPVWRRMAWGALPKYDRAGSAHGGFPTLKVWAGLKLPILLIAGELDNVTKPEELGKIARFLQHEINAKGTRGETDKMHTNGTIGTDQADDENDGDAAQQRLVSKPQNSQVELTTSKSKGSANGRPQDPELTCGDDMAAAEDDQGGENDGKVAASHRDGNHPEKPVIDGSEQRRILKTMVLPAPASHAMLYDHATYRALAGLIETFLWEKIDYRLSLGWQLQHMSTAGKWDVKNLVKWQKGPRVSEPIAGVFRAMKTLRGIDEIHTPKKFVQDWKGKIYAVIDISHDSPVYDPAELQNGGIEYHKFSTVSKIPPTADEVVDFIALVERIRAQAPFVEKGADIPVIGAHCHYGFNRTGFFIVCYLVEKLGYRLEDAVEEFAKNRPPGIKHSHFHNELCVRYTRGLKRSATE